MALGVGRAVGWLSRHPKTLVGGAAVAGIMAAHPFKGTGIGSAFMEQTTGDPNAFKTVARARISQAVHDMVATEGEKNAFEYLSQNYSRVPSTSLYSPGGGPSGNVVFGMYNLRIK